MKKSVITFAVLVALMMHGCAGSDSPETTDITDISGNDIPDGSDVSDEADNNSVNDSIGDSQGQPDSIPPNDIWDDFGSSVPRLSVTASGSLAGTSGPLEDGDSITFDGQTPITLTLGNTGDLSLHILNIEIVSQNGCMGMTPSPSDITFPHEVAPKSYLPTQTSALKIKIDYYATTNLDNTPTIIKVFTDDYSNGSGIFTFSINRAKIEAALKITPAAYIFMEATPSEPRSAVFTLRNPSDQAIAIADVRFNPETTAYVFTSSRIDENSIINPEGSGSTDAPVTITVQYTSQNIPDQTTMEVRWVEKRSTGVWCNETADCQSDQSICRNGSEGCPYSCTEGICGCTATADCQAYFCNAPENCRYQCLTGICRRPQVDKVALSGKELTGKLNISYANRAAGCIDFIDQTTVGQTCTKTISIGNDSPNPTTITRPYVMNNRPGAPQYAVKYYRAGAVQAPDDSCGEVVGDEITDSTYILTSENQPVTAAITYTAASETGFNEDLRIPYRAPYHGEQIVRLCGGNPKGELAVITPDFPALLFVPPSLGMMATPGSTDEDSMALINKGNADLEITGIDIALAASDNPLAFSIAEETSAGAAELWVSNISSFTLAAGEQRIFTVSYDGDFEIAGSASRSVNIRYIDPATEQEATQEIVLGASNKRQCVKIPTANAGDPANYANVKVGDLIVLDGSASEGATFDIPADSGYNWLLRSRPATSRAFLYNRPGPAQIAFIPDAAGTYVFGLRVMTTNADEFSDVFVFEGSDEATISINVGEQAASDAGQYSGK